MSIAKRDFRQVVVPRPFSLPEQTDTLVVVGMPVEIDSVVAQLFAPANLRNSLGQPWNSQKALGAIIVELYHPAEVVFRFQIPVHFRERKRYMPPLDAVERFKSDLPLFVRAQQNFSVDGLSSIDPAARVDLVVHLIPDFYEG